MEEKKVDKPHKSSKKHKHKKSKKHKKEKHSSDSDESVEMEWVEAAPKPAEKSRESWMTQEEEFVPTLSREQMRVGELTSRERKKRAEQERSNEEKEVLRARELNPHWSGGGTGLPVEAEPVSKPRLPSLSVGDGGHAFLTKARIRIREQAEREGRSMEEVAVERWGSLSALDALIAEAEERMHSHSRERYRDERRHRSPERSIQFQKPSDRRRHDKCNVSSSRREKGRSHDKVGVASDRRTSDDSDDSSSRRRSHGKVGVASNRRTSGDSDDSRRRSHDEVGVATERRTPESYEVSSRRERGRGYDKVGVDSEKRTSDERILEKWGVSSKDESRARLPAWKKARSGDATSRGTSSTSHPKKIHEETPPEDAREDSPNRMRAELSGDPALTSRLAEEEKACRLSGGGTSEDCENRLAARRMRAELAGDTALAARLLEEEKACRSSRGGTGTEDGQNRLAARRMRAEPIGEERANQRERVMLTKMDSSGQQRPVVSTREESGFERRRDRQQKRPNKYFDDTSKYSLKQMFEREKLTTTEDHLEMFVEVSAQCDDSKDENETSGLSKRATQKMSHVGQEEKDIQKAMQQHQKLNAAVERCEYCLDQPTMKRHLIIDIHEQVLVCVPNFQSLVSGHCLVVPKRHVPSLLHLEEDEWNGLQDAVGRIRRMFQSRGKSVVCLETSFFFSRCPHAVLECVPLPPEEGAMAPFYFRKAILECEEEWAHNVKLVDLTNKGLRRSIPKNLPYFCVTFDPSVHAGFAHVIEDEKAFPRNFGKEVVGGMLDVDYCHLYKNRREDPVHKSKEAAEFTRMWEEELAK